MQCRDVRELLDSFVGEELLVETSHELLRHLETCPDCRAELEARRNVRASLKRAFTAAGSLQMRPEFAAEVASRLKSDKRPAPFSERQVTKNPASRAASWRAVTPWVVAASILIGVATGVFMFRTGIDEIARNAVGDHLNCAVQFRLAEKPISLDEAASRFDPMFGRLRTIPPDDVATSRGDLHAVDRHSCVFEGHRYAHVVYKLDDHLVSVLVTPGVGAESPRSTTRPLTILPRRIDGLGVASIMLPEHAAFVVSDFDNPQFEQIARALADPLYRELVAAREYSMLFR